jgi:hypothetical protein
MVSAAIPGVIEDKGTLVPKNHDMKMYMRLAGEVSCILDDLFLSKIKYVILKKIPTEM